MDCNFFECRFVQAFLEYLAKTLVVWSISAILGLSNRNKDHGDL